MTKQILGSSIWDRLDAEMVDAAGKHGYFASSHEGWGVLSTKTQGLLDAIRRNEGPDVQTEAIQVASAALWIAFSCDDKAFQRRSGFLAPNPGPE